jgi:hypothetical protein
MTRAEATIIGPSGVTRQGHDVDRAKKRRSIHVWSGGHDEAFRQH